MNKNGNMATCKVPMREIVSRIPSPIGFEKPGYNSKACSSYLIKLLFAAPLAQTHLVFAIMCLKSAVISENNGKPKSAVVSYGEYW